MNDAALKAKVLLAVGVLVSFLGMLYAPVVMKALVPLAVCAAFAAMLMFAPELIDAAKRNQAKNRKGQATSVAKVPSGATCRVVSFIPVDYDNYVIPTYLRRREVV